MSDIHSNEEDARCLDDRDDGTCQGEVEFNSTDGIAYWPRCAKHFDLRLQRSRDSLERYANSDVPPSWFDPTACGERWDEDY